MFRNYLKIAWRNIVKHRFYSAINIFGLTVGMTCCFLIFMFVRFELSYDTFHRKADQIYRVSTDVKTPTELIRAAITSAPMGPAMKADFPEVLNMVRVNAASWLIQQGDNKYQEDKVLLADSSFFDVFSFRLLKGNAASALRAPFSIVLTERAAHKYFGDADPMGKSLLIEGEYSATVTGIMKDVPANSQLDFDMLASMSTLTKALQPGIDEQWGNFGMGTYVVLPPGADPMQLERKLPAFMESHIGDMMKRGSMYYTLRLEKLTDVYLHSTREAPVKGNLSNIYIFAVVAAFILFIAIFNFVNLATAKATERAKEVGVRKSIGAFTSQLTLQFLCETILLSLLAFVLSLVCCQLLLPAFNALVGKEIRTYVFDRAGDLYYFFGTAVAVGLLAGAYPALILAAYKPALVLKGAFGRSDKGLSLRKCLVAIQFVTAIILIAGVTIVYRQLAYMHQQPLGFKKEQMLVMDFTGVRNLQTSWPDMKQRIARLPGVERASFSSSVPGEGQSSAYTLIENKAGDMQPSNINLYSVDYDFIQQYQVKVIAGRAFSPAFASDSTAALLVNEAVVSSLGYAQPQDIIGKRYSQWGREGRIVGVVRNFNYRSLRAEVEPLTLRLEPRDFDVLSLNVSTAGIPATLSALEQAFTQLAPERRFSYYFLDEAFDRQYRTDYRFGRLILLAAILAIIIASLGLLGLISYIVTQRTKEIGIRKVLGASVINLLLLLSRDFLKLVMIAMLIATPVAWYVMHRWLQDFAYRIHIEWWMFLLAGLGAVVVAMVTVGLQSVKAALVNPVKSLRTE
ncbi:ABC transporter permease [Chitinophaga japonensis]|uniref:Putative ABC transport system permease protein n=1 Tax=Chitinophaga japonensis TaxID=104662 RepID=A0A562TF96_CHIJA|nr:ABC transporter permease [Chitinophaga japonensis]TWI91944.1 putative ABC transport system permease protein [Chitinophaga japonensis]